MTVEVLAIGLTALVHFIGAGVLVWALLDGDGVDWRGFWPRDDQDDGPPPPLLPRAPSGGMPLPDAAQSAVRLREPGRLVDAHPRRPRRPEHMPAPQRTRTVRR